MKTKNKIGSLVILFFFLIAAVVIFLYIDNKLVKKNICNKKKNIIIDRIIIDPGHGGRDRGASYKNIYEHDISYDISKRLYKKLKNKDIPVFITINEKNTFLSNGRPVTLKNRIELIKKMSTSERSLVLSIHVNSLHESFNGLSVFYSADKMNSENTGFWGHCLSQNLIHNDVQGFQFSLGPLSIPLKRVRSRFYRFNFVPALFSATGNLMVLIIETGNIRNKYDRIKLTDFRYREKIASILSQSIVKRINSNGN